MSDSIALEYYIRGVANGENPSLSPRLPFPPKVVLLLSALSPHIILSPLYRATSFMDRPDDRSLGSSPLGNTLAGIAARYRGIQRPGPAIARRSARIRKYTPGRFQPIPLDLHATAAANAAPQAWAPQALGPEGSSPASSPSSVGNESPTAQAAERRFFRRIAPALATSESMEMLRPGDINPPCELPAFR